MADEPYDEHRDGELRGGYNKNSDQCHNRDKYGHGALSHLTRTVPFEKFDENRVTRVHPIRLRLSGLVRDT